MTTLVCFKDEIIKDSAQRDLELSDDEIDALHGVGIGSDHTLCGLAYGEYVPKNRKGKITCDGYTSAIMYHKSFKKGKDY